MISIKTQTNLGHAKSYFREHLNSGDYYSSTGATPGVWSGKGAAMLGLSGQVSENDFLALCRGEKPDGSRLTQRTNTVRQGDTANRRIFFDWTVCPPKSVSIAALVHGDDRIKQAHARAIAKAGAELEQFAAARVRSKNDPLNGKDRTTGNLCMASFTHETSRAVEEGATPDPLLHSHVLIFNATKDNNQWKALQSFDMLKAQKYIEAVYDHELTRELRAMGYRLRESTTGWELAHISDATCQKFSKRRQAILEKTAELEKAGVKSGHETIKDNVAHDARIRKQGNMSAEALRESWISQMDERELTPDNLYSSVEIIGKRETPSDALNWSIKHLFERSAVVKDTDLLSSALRSARGGNFSLESLKAEFEENPSILRELGGRRVTTENALETERYILRSVHDGKGIYLPLAPALLPTAGNLNPLQRQAAEMLISSRDLVSVFSGGAGTGKSFTLRHVSDALEANGLAVVVLAPQNQQVQDLRTDGFKAQTVASFLTGPNQLDSNSVVIVDEAGLIGGEDMASLLAKAKMSGARVLLSGDTKQKTSVARSDALRAIERYAKPHVAELSGEKAIHRQKVADYRRAVACAERGDTGQSWALLEGLGSIKDTTIATRTQDAAKLYVEKLEAGGSVLMLSQTNAEVDALNTAIRAELAGAGKLDQTIQMDKSTLRGLDLTTAQKEMAGSYPPDSVVLLNRKLGDHAAGTTGRFLRENGQGGVVLDLAGKEVEVSQKDLGRLTVCEQRDLSLFKGDRIQLKANVKIGRDKKLANGQILTVTGEDKTGRLLVLDANGLKHALPADFRQFTYGYAVTSYGSQGKTVDHVIVSDSQCKAATDRKDFYVAISRGRQTCSILTSDRELLKDHICALGERDLATDLKLAPKAEIPAEQVAVPTVPQDPQVPQVPRVEAPAVEVEIESTKELQPLLGPSGAKEQPLCLDATTGERVQLYGNQSGNLAVRGLGNLADVVIRSLRGIGRLGRMIENTLDSHAQIFR